MKKLGMLQKTLLAATVAAAPALLGLSCESIFSGPAVGSGDVDESWFQTRASAYLQHAAAIPNTSDPMRVLAQLEWAKRDPGFTPPALPADAFTANFSFIASLADTGDFRALYFLNLLFAHRNDPALGAAQAAQIEQSLLSFKFWYDEPSAPGLTDNRWYWSENHQLIYHTLELLMGQEYPTATFSNDGKTGAQHLAHARPRVLKWLDHRLRFGFSEWHSDVYYQKDIEPLITLVEWTSDAEIRTKASAVLDLVLFDIGAHSLRGNMGVTHGRTYKKDTTKAIDQDVFNLSKLLFDETSEAYTPGASAGATLLARSAQYRLPEAIRRIGKSREISVDRQRMNLPIPELGMTKEQQALSSAGEIVFPPPVRGVSFSDPADFDVWLSQAALTAWPVVPHTLNMLETYNLWESEQFKDFKSLRAIVDQGDGLNIAFAQQIAAGLARMLSFGQLSEVNTYTYRTPDYMLSTAQSYRPGNRSDQRHTWQATLDERAIVFTTHPGLLPPVTTAWGDDNEPGPSYWTGEATLPRSAQHENVGIHIYAPQYVPQNSAVTRAISRYQSFTHAFFPKSRFDEVVQDGHWVFGRRGDGYVALYSYRLPAFKDYAGTGWATDGMTEPFDLRAEGGPDNVWIVECGRAADWSGRGGFAGFRAALVNAPVGVTSLGPPANGTQSSGFSVVFESPSQGLMRFGWEAPLEVAGQEIPIADYPRHASPWAQQAFGARRVLIMDQPFLDEGYGVWIDFEKGVRRSFGPATVAP